MTGNHCRTPGDGGPERGGECDGQSVEASFARPRLRRLLPRRGDYALLLLSAAAFAASLALAGSERPGADYVAVKSGHGEYVYPLDEDRILRVEGPLGKTVVRIEGGAVSFLESPCRDKLCVGMGAVSENRRVVACLPNKVIATVRKPHDHRP